MAPISAGVRFFSPKKTNLRWLCLCLDFWVFKLRLQPSSQKVSKLLGESIGAHYMGARAVALPETAPPPICIAKMYENLVFLSLLFWRTARATARTPIYFLPMNFLSILDAFWVPGCNRSSKTRSCKFPWNLKNFWKIENFFQNQVFFKNVANYVVFEIV